MDTTISPHVSKSIEHAVFDAALLIEDEKERESFLRMFFRGNRQGLDRVRRMLNQRGESSAFFLDASEHRGILAKEILRDEPDEALLFEPDIEKLGTKVGPYVLISRIGEGGCGVVYEAEQLEPVRRRVALKVIRLGMDTESVIARFAAEKQALALMDHPNIAHVYDAGTTETGRPYFVMERVSGERITAFCDREQLNIASRIELFIQVCHAIQHAHHKGVVHRDIKPSNILVTLQDGAPTPKVIDFGIAKATEPHLLEGSRTMVDQIVGTPPYMSPEQVELTGIDVDTRSDVYALGALLHELLGGAPPFDEGRLAKASISEMRRILLEEEPPLLSRKLAGLPGEELVQIAAARGEQPARFIARLRGDLDWIVAMALAKDRNRRYQTVTALATDLRRFLASEPVSASQPSRLYLARKFLRRNRIACVSGAAVVVSLVAGLGAATSMYLSEREALAEQERLRRVAESARSHESRLRKQAQARANVSQAAVLLADGKIDEADELLRESPLDSIEPSREAARVFRVLGDRNAFYGRWKQALQCFVLLDQANRLDDPTRIVEKIELLMIAPALQAHGDPGAYEKFRRETLDNYLPARNANQAEHLLKACLLSPADETILRRLKGSAEICADPKPPKNGQPQWNAFALTLYNHRLGDSRETLKWGKKCLAYADPAGSRAAAVLALTAMAHFRSGHPQKGMADIEEAQLRLLKTIPSELRMLSPKQGSWYDRLIAQILIDEAEREMGLAAPTEAASSIRGNIDIR